jgi:hypothetical protein
LKLAKNYITNNLHEQKEKKKTARTLPKQHHVPLIFKDSFSISLQDDILGAQRLAQREQGRGPSLQKQKDQQHLPCETSRNKKKSTQSPLNTSFEYFREIQKKIYTL